MNIKVLVQHRLMTIDVCSCINSACFFFYHFTIQLFVGIKHENYLNDKNDVIALQGGEMGKKWEKNLIFDLKKRFPKKSN